MTDARNTQTALEQWTAPNPDARVSQVSLEQWGLTGTVATRAVATQVALEEWATLVARAPIELAGNLGGVSSYGSRSYGVKQYSRVQAFEPVLSAALTVSIGRALSGDLASSVSLGGALGAVRGVSGGFSPVIEFAANLVVIGFVDFAGGIAPQIDFNGALSADLSLTVLEGGLTANVALEALSFISEPLWAASEPCPAPAWAASEPCPLPAWMITEPCAPVAWTPTRLCNG